MDMVVIDNCLGKFGINGKRVETLFERAIEEEEVVRVRDSEVSLYRNKRKIDTF